MLDEGNVTEFIKVLKYLLNIFYDIVFLHNVHVCLCVN